MRRAKVFTGNRFVVPVLGGAIAVLLVSAGLAAANIPSSSGVINGCYNTSTGVLRVIDKEAGKACSGSETALNWNQTGPRGPTGATGPAGPPGPGAETPAGQDAYMSCTGQQQGKFNGGVTLKGFENSIEVVAAGHEVVSPRDAASGLPSGKRQHRPFTIVKPVDRSTPLFHNAMSNNENLTTCIIKFVQLNKSGGLTTYYTVTLTNASVAGIEMGKGDTRTPIGRFAEYEEISFTYQKITWLINPGGITAEDDWETPVS